LTRLSAVRAAIATCRSRWAISSVESFHWSARRVSDPAGSCSETANLRHLGVIVSSGLTFDRHKSRKAVKAAMFGTCEAFQKNAFPLSRSHCAITKHFSYVFTTTQPSVCCTSEDCTTPHKAKTFKRAFVFHSTGSKRYRSERHRHPAIPGLR
jgi:hypothetical protein